MVRRVLACLLAAALAAPCAAADPTGLKADVAVSTAAPPISWHLGYEPAAVPAEDGSGEGGSVGVGAGISEGKPLEMLLWGGAGAMAGAVTGPVGAGIGAAAGALIGLAVSLFASPNPKRQPDFARIFSGEDACFILADGATGEVEVLYGSRRCGEPIGGVSTRDRLEAARRSWPAAGKASKAPAFDFQTGSGSDDGHAVGWLLGRLSSHGRRHAVITSITDLTPSADPRPAETRARELTQRVLVTLGLL